MKSLFSSLLCASLLIFTVGCGKENKSGGGVAVNPYQNLYNSGLSSNSQAVLQKVTNWYNGATEGQAMLGVVNITKTKYDYNTAPNCEQKTFLGIPYTYCTYSNTSSSGTVVSTQSGVNLVQDGNLISAKGNAELNGIFSGASGTLIDAIDLSSSVSNLVFLRNDGVIVSYLIDRNYHSLLNPVKKTETSQASKSDIVVTAQKIY